MISPGTGVPDRADSATNDDRGKTSEVSERLTGHLGGNQGVATEFQSLRGRSIQIIHLRDLPRLIFPEAVDGSGDPWYVFVAWNGIIVLDSPG